MPSQPLTFGSLRAALSEERLKAYQRPGDADDLDAVARYLWNASLATALHPALHAVEVTFRNHLYVNSCKIVEDRSLRFNEVQCWLDADPTLLYDREFLSVNEAKTLLKKGKKPMTPGRLISKLGFGFWCGLCRRPYEQGRASGPALWPGLIKAGFPFLPKEHSTRSQIMHRFEEIRELRNRVSHLEPIWDRNIKRTHARIIAAIGWMNQGVAAAVERISQLDAVANTGPEGHRELAESLIKSDGRLAPSGN